MSQACYEQVFGQTPEENAVLVSYDTQADGAQELEQKLVSLDGVSSLTRIEDTRKTFGTSLESVDYAVALIIVCAAALAFVVLYNLTNINITERMRELATLKVLGFYDGELSAYIYRENVILTVFGVAMGIVMGKFLHQWLILTVEIDPFNVRPHRGAHQLSVGGAADHRVLPGGQSGSPPEAEEAGYGGVFENRRITPAFLKESLAKNFVRNCVSPLRP